jgi:hypothetical protein
MRPVWVLAAVLLLAGCGGGRVVTPARPEASRSAELQRYLERMGRGERRFGVLAGGVSQAFAGIDTGRPGPAWIRVAERLDPISTGLNRLGGDLGQITPPKRLARAHHLLAESTLAFGSYVYSVEQALRVKIPSVLLTSATADTSAITRARRQWVRAVQRYCGELGLAPPEWMVPSPAA